MSADQTLWVKLVDLPGFDPTGLRHVPDDVIIGRLFLRQDEDAVDFGDAATRDRAARWLAGKLDLGFGSTAPTLEGWSTSWVLCGADDEVGFVRPVGTYSRAYGPIVEALADIDPEDARRLEDGSRWVDAAALAAVCRHVGAEPREDG